jgi:hypothetical protein
LYRDPQDLADLEQFRRLRACGCGLILDKELANLYNVTLSVFEALQNHGVRAPGDFDQFFGFEYMEKT